MLFIIEMEGFLFCEKAPQKAKKVLETIEESLEFKHKSKWYRSRTYALQLF